MHLRLINNITTKKVEIYLMLMNFSKGEKKTRNLINYADEPFVTV